MSNVIYEIEILGWEKHNKKSTKNMPSIMVSKRFFDDAKIQSLPQSGKLLYLFLLLRRGDVDINMFECSHDDCVNAAGGRGVLVESLLDRLQSFQLLRYQKVAINRIEKNRIEKNRIEVGAEAKNPPKNPLPKKESEPKKEENKKLSTKGKSLALCGCIGEFSHEAAMVELMAGVSHELQKSWIETYKNVPWIIFELSKCRSYFLSKPEKKPKSRFGVFYTHWLSRGFEQYRKNLSSRGSAQPRGNWVEEHNRKVMQSLDEMDSQEKVVKSES